MPEATVAHDRDRGPAAFRVERRSAGCAEPIAHGRIADIERWQCCKKVTPDVATDMEFAELLLQQLQAREYRPFRATGAQAWWTRRHMRCDIIDEFRHELQRVLRRLELSIEIFQEVDDARTQDLACVFPSHRQRALADEFRLATGLAQHRVERLLDVIRLAFFHQQDRTFIATELVDLVIDHRVGDIHHVNRYLRAAECIGDAKSLHRTQQRIVEAALHDDPKIIALAFEHFIETMCLDVVHCRRPALVHFLLFMHERRRRQHNAFCVTGWIFHRFAQ